MASSGVRELSKSAAFLFVHDSVSPSDQLSKRCRIPGIKARRSQADGKLVIGLLPACGVQEFSQAFADGGFALPRSFNGQGSELVASKPSNDVGITESRFQCLGSTLERGVAFAVAEEVVDFFQSVNVNEEQEEAAAEAPGELQLALCESEKAAAIVQAR